MNTLVKILLLLTASSYALALCGEKCSKTLSCKDIHTCLVQNCSTFSAVDLPDNCKCNGKCKEEFDTVYIRKDNCLFLQRLKTCFQKESCDSQYVPELKKFEQDCTNCEPKQCNEEKCLSQLNCFTNSSRGACRSAADVQKVLNSTSKTMYNVWFLPEKCACAAKCAYVTLRFIPSCKGYEQTKKCWDANNCVKDTSSWNMAPCQCDFACSTELSKAKAATEHSEKCKAQTEFNLCAEKFGCKQRPTPIQKIDCSDHSGSGTPYFGSKLLPAAFIATTILFAFITTNLFMA